MSRRTTRLAVADLQAFTTALFAARGMPAETAAAVADTLVWAEQRGVTSHGVGRVDRYLYFIDEGTMQPTAEPRIGMSAGAVYRVDGVKGPGAAAMRLALEHGATLAAQSGVSWGVVSNTTHIGALGYYAEKAAARGLAAIVFSSGTPLMAYHGAKVPTVHTAPIAMGVPTNGDPVILDMATSNVANGRLQQAKQAGQTIPDDWALTPQGERTTDSKVAEILLPMGGAKGSGLALMFEFLSGVLAGTPVLIPALSPGQAPRPAANATLILLDVSRFRSLSDFTTDTSTLGDLVKSLAPIDPGVEIRLPGERGAAALRSNRDTIEIATKTWEQMTRHGQTLSCTPPLPLSD